MTTQNYFRSLDKYRAYEDVIHDLLASILTSLDSEALLNEPQSQLDAIAQLSRAYPFVELIYCLDVSGIQQQETVYSPMVSSRGKRSFSKGSDRSRRPYFLAAKESASKVVVTQPYLSSATHQLALSSVQHVISDEGEDMGYLVINFSLMRLLSYLLGDGLRNRIHPLFQAIYTLIGGSLILVSLWLLVAAFLSLIEGFSLLHDTTENSFSVVVMITLGLAIFDLGKTILEEEVLVSKDINHYNSTRRTIMRFMSAIIIAVSIEALLLMFKSVLDPTNGQVMNGVWMLFSGVGLLAGLGVYLKLSQGSE